MSGRLWLLNATYAKFISEIDRSHGLSEKAWDRYMRRRWRDHCWQLEISIEGVDLSGRVWAAPGSERAQMQWPRWSGRCSAWQRKGAWQRRSTFKNMSACYERDDEMLAMQVEIMNNIRSVRYKHTSVQKFWPARDVRAMMAWGSLPTTSMTCFASVVERPRGLFLALRVHGVAYACNFFVHSIFARNMCIHCL